MHLVTHWVSMQPLPALAPLTLISSSLAASCATRCTSRERSAAMASTSRRTSASSTALARSRYLGGISRGRKARWRYGSAVRAFRSWR